ncbi:MAG: hypothetical protein HY329_20345 [Chloroflexi bacterium]|nr:hypothetical protein [Chloroflexota bacterium]
MTSKYGFDTTKRDAAQQRLEVIRSQRAEWLRQQEEEGKKRELVVRRIDHMLRDIAHDFMRSTGVSGVVAFHWHNPLAKLDCKWYVREEVNAGAIYIGIFLTFLPKHFVGQVLEKPRIRVDVYSPIMFRYRNTISVQNLLKLCQTIAEHTSCEVDYRGPRDRTVGHD